MLDLNGLNIGYRNTLVGSINRTTGTPQLIGLAGKNGCGKSTLLRTICKEIEPIQGEVKINGEALSTLPGKSLAQLVSISHTGFSTYGNCTVRDVVMLGRLPHTGFFGRLKSEDQAKVDQVMENLDISKLADSLFDRVSDGERQKALLARCLVQETPLILLDEPTAFLDPPSKARLFDILQDQVRNHDKTILVSSHDLELLESRCDDIWLISNQKIIAKPESDFQLAWDSFKQ